MADGFIEKAKEKATNTLEGLKKQYGIDQASNPWPTTYYDANMKNDNPYYLTSGFLPPYLIPVDTDKSPYLQYTYTDWRGQTLVNNGRPLTTSDRFNEGERFPKDLLSESYSTRDMHLIFNDNATDYFKHGLQIIDNLNKVTDSNRLGSFVGTSYEVNDPIIYGFEIVFDDISSPLLNGSIVDFITNYSSISEVANRMSVYEDFKQQFVKFFKTKSTVNVENITNITKMREASYPEAESNNNLFGSGKKSYLNYYLKKISGLDALSERNTPKEKKFLNKYNEDVISLSFSEDVSMSMGTLVHLYKLLYWSKPNGKGIIPENLLRFNCDIIISEIRNFNRVRKNNNNLEIIRDNVSRYVYSLKECQFYFNQMPHPNEVDIGSSLSIYDNYTMQFDYKYVTTKLERFMPLLDGSGFGQYVGYDGGSIWKIGNGSSVNNTVKSIPEFLTKGDNKLNENGVSESYVVNIPSPIDKRDLYEDINNENVNELSKFKLISKEKIKELGNKLSDKVLEVTTREIQTKVNTQTALLNTTLNKIAESINVKSMRPPYNIYDGKLTTGEKIFYDVRGELFNFVGDSVRDALNGNFINKRV